MTERRKLKKELAQLKRSRRMLPHLIDCCEVYGDNSFDKDDYSRIDKQITDLELRIEQLKEEK